LIHTNEKEAFNKTILQNGNCTRSATLRFNFMARDPALANQKTE
jgi:hypothetical protein